MAIVWGVPNFRIFTVMHSKCEDVKTLMIRLLLQEQTDPGLYCLL